MMDADIKVKCTLSLIKYHTILLANPCAFFPLYILCFAGVLQLGSNEGGGNKGRLDLMPTPVGSMERHVYGTDRI